MNTLNKKKALFVDRDGVIVIEDQIDTYERIIYIPHMFEALRTIIKKGDWELVMVSNQDGVGTPSFPMEDYQMVADRIFSTLEGEGIVFDDVNVDFSLPEDNCPGRKPGTAMLTKYMNGDYDMSKSFMVGDRLTDMQLAKNLGCRGFWLTEESETPEEYKDVIALRTDNWLDIAAFLTDDTALAPRKAVLSRKTKETDIEISLSLDGTGRGTAHSGLGFFDHMLDQVIRHSRCDLTINTDGDLVVDEHHTIEDTALLLGECYLKALGDKRGIERYGFEIVAMDEVAATVAIDFSGRPELVWDVEFNRDYVGDVPTELFKHFFRSFSSTARCNLYISATKGGDTHHTAEAIFKGFARAIRKAVKRIPGATELPSTKGVL